MKIDIDHVVPLREAWLSGANQWSRAKRIQFANDTANLAISLASVNRSKGAKDIPQWQPDSGKCDYLRQWIAVKQTYGLGMDRRETDAVNRLRAVC